MQPRLVLPVLPVNSFATMLEAWLLGKEHDFKVGKEEQTINTSNHIKLRTENHERQ